MNGEAAFSLWLLLLGPVAGSYVTALADRICDGRSVMAPRSHCDACGQTLGARDLVPLLSYACLRGRCRFCGHRIPPHLFFGEVAGLAASGLALAFSHSITERGVAALFLFLLIGLFQADRSCYRLPDTFTVPLFVVGVGLGALYLPLWQVLLAAVTGPVALWLVARIYEQARGRPGLGFGDVKIMGGLSAAVGLSGIPWITLVAASAALLVALVTDRRFRAGRRQPFGCYLAVAGALVWLAR
ncbi:prepilin peptidase [Sulfitobacter sp. D35]|uniref:prepilin peptidase n=1 Tax=Sulfitobacter sp. D35 TaxID=3083252 RepID=UPI00296F1006|nr:prepilin peptidase [Sulfitobacter sp. D35]MDW4500483.1 prepilin peptidase [Sulfitobacter sp. D35]